MDPRKKLCVVFDIDETLIHFVNNKYRSLWDNLNPQIKNNLRAVDNGKDVIILRPHIEELFNYFRQTPNIKVGLWTYSEREYSRDIANILINELDLPKDFFYFTWGSEDIDESDSGLPKDLTQIYNKFPNFNKFNTFLVDDLYKNLNHNVNKQNCVLIQPFAPFGTSKARSDIGIDDQFRVSNDTAFMELIQISGRVLQDILNCDSQDIDEGFEVETVFGEKRVKRMNLIPFLKTYAVKFIKMLTIGQPMEAKEFIMVDPEKYNVHIKGGKKLRHKKTKNKIKRRKITTRRKKLIKKIT